ncbi:hypothetical protein niasHT_025721 [Heterodera trifolii]|uniref:Uncharacterized protein n=1 Tax=Heterodera trifolii TaxID=157864 RepID=A0ABD2K8Z7_9BILA
MRRTIWRFRQFNHLSVEEIVKSEELLKRFSVVFCRHYAVIRMEAFFRPVFDGLRHDTSSLTVRRIISSKSSLSVEEIAKSVELLKLFPLCSVAITPVSSASAKKPSAAVSPRHRVLGDPNAVVICAVPFQNMSRTLLALNNCTVLRVTSSKCLLSVEEIAKSVERLKRFALCSVAITRVTSASAKKSSVVV